MKRMARIASAVLLAWVVVLLASASSVRAGAPNALNAPGAAGAHAAPAASAGFVAPNAPPPPNAGNVVRPGFVGAISGPHLVIVTELGDRMVEMVPRGGGYFGGFQIENDGNQPLTVSRTRVRGDSGDVRAPGNITVNVGEGAPGSIVVLAPGQSRHVTATWTPGKTVRVKTLFAQVLFESNDPSNEGRPVVVGIHAQVPGLFPPVTSHPLVWLLLLPMLGAVFALYLQMSKKTSEASDEEPISPRSVALGFAALHTAIALSTYAAFDTDLTRVDGNDGLQFVEHGVLFRSLGVESFLAVDGLSLVPLVVISLAGLVALATSGDSPAERRLVPLILVLTTAATGLFTAFDAALFVLFLAFTAAAAMLLVSRGGATVRSARAFALPWIAAFACVALSIWLLCEHSGPAYLVDGSPVAHTLSITELARVGFTAKHDMIGGSPLVTLVTPILVVGFALLLAAGPLLGTTAGALATSTPSVAIAVGGSTMGAGAYGLLRLLATILPEATRWAAPTLALFGAFVLLYACLVAHGEKDPYRRGAVLACATGAAAFVGLGGLTAEGVEGAMMAVAAPQIALVLLGATRTPAVATRAKRTRVLAILALLAAGAVFGPSTWTLLLSGIGAFATAPLAAVVCLLSFVLAAAIALQGARALPRPKDAKPVGTVLAAFPAYAMAALVLVLGVWPVALFGAQGGAARALVDVIDPPGPDQIAALTQLSTDGPTSIP